jgi:hypothetical protein
MKMWGVAGRDDAGVFYMYLGPEKTEIHIIATTGDGWDHVSVSCQLRTPTWDEMEQVKRLFFKLHETAMQLHVPPHEHVNCHPHTLHLWRPIDVVIPRPPEHMV